MNLTEMKGTAEAYLGTKITDAITIGTLGHRKSTKTIRLWNRCFCVAYFTVPHHRATMDIGQSCGLESCGRTQYADLRCRWRHVSFLSADNLGRYLRDRGDEWCVHTSSHGSSGAAYSKMKFPAFVEIHSV